MPVGEGAPGLETNESGFSIAIKPQPLPLKQLSTGRQMRRLIIQTEYPLLDANVAASCCFVARQPRRHAERDRGSHNQKLFYYKSTSVMDGTAQARITPAPTFIAAHSRCLLTQTHPAMIAFRL
jgi:hypothetical protein